MAKYKSGKQDLAIGFDCKGEAWGNSFVMTEQFCVLKCDGYMNLYKELYMKTYQNFKTNACKNWWNWSL